MKIIHFQKNKYGVELLMDLANYQDIPHYHFEPELHQTDFFEIIFIETAKGKLYLDQQQIQLQTHAIIFISPLQKRQWFVEKESIESYFLAFQESFLNDFFSDKLFVYRLQYFFNYHNALFLKTNDSYFVKIQRTFQDILSEIKHYQSDSHHIIRSLLYYLLTLLNREYALHYQLSDETQNHYIAYQFKALLEKYIHQNLRVEDYAQKLGISRITLSK